MLVLLVAVRHGNVFAAGRRLQSDHDGSLLESCYSDIRWYTMCVQYTYSYYNIYIYTSIWWFGVSLYCYSDIQWYIYVYIYIYRSVEFWKKWWNSELAAAVSTLISFVCTLCYTQYIATFIQKMCALFFVQYFVLVTCTHNFATDTFAIFDCWWQCVDFPLVGGPHFVEASWVPKLLDPQGTYHNYWICPKAVSH